jgi:hypothetical protein
MEALKNDSTIEEKESIIRTKQEHDGEKDDCRHSPNPWTGAVFVDRMW